MKMKKITDEYYVFMVIAIICIALSVILRLIFSEHTYLLIASGIAVGIIGWWLSYVLSLRLGAHYYIMSIMFSLCAALLPLDGARINSAAEEYTPALRTILASVEKFKNEQGNKSFTLLKSTRNPISALEVITDKSGQPYFCDSESKEILSNGFIRISTKNDRVVIIFTDGSGKTYNSDGEFTQW